MACAVYHFVKRCAVVFGGFGKLLQEWKHNAVCGGLIICGIPFVVFQLHPFALNIVCNDAFGGFVCCCGIHGEVCRVLCGNPFALIDVKNIVIPKEGDLLDFAGFFILFVDPFPENHDL